MRRASACRYCGAEIVPGAAFCGNCGENLVFQDEPRATTRRIPVVGSYVQPPPTEPVAGVLARIVALYAIVGIGVGGAVLSFLWVFGFLHHSSADQTDVGRAIVGVIAIVVTLAFAFLIGFVLAPIGAHYAATHLNERDAAVVAAGIGAAIGQCVLIGCLALSLAGGISLFTASSSASSSIDYVSLAKGCIGGVAAGLVGAFSAMVLFDRRHR